MSKGNKNIGITFFPKYDVKGASSRYRTHQYLPFFKHAHASPLFSDEYISTLHAGKSRFFLVGKAYLRRTFYLLFSGPSFAVIEKELFPWVPYWIECWFLPKKYVLDYDDAIFVKYQKTILKNKLKKLMKRAECVMVGSAYLEEYIRNSGGTPVYIPTVVNDKKYPQKKGEEPASFVIGWIGSPSTSVYLLDIKEVLEEMVEKYNVSFLFIGASDGVKKCLTHLPVQWEEWSEKTEVSLLQQCTVGIMPLRNTHWERGKCGFKLIQYMACFLPVIASDVGENSTIVGDAGYVVKKKEEWMEAIEKLKEKSHREELGEKGKERVRNKYSLEVQAKKYVETIEIHMKSDK